MSTTRWHCNTDRLCTFLMCAMRAHTGIETTKALGHLVHETQATKTVLSFLGAYEGSEFKLVISMYVSCQAVTYSLHASHILGLSTPRTVGNSGVGKTTFVKQFLNTFPRYNATVGADVHHIPLKTNHGKIKFHVWDNAGSEKFPGVPYKCDAVIHPTAHASMQKRNWSRFASSSWSPN